MRVSPFIDLRRGAEFLWNRPLWSLSLAAIGTLLSALAPLLQIQTRLPDTQAVLLGLTMAATLPLDLYLIPRFLLAVDAETLDHPRNPKQDWRSTFEDRWMLAFGARLLLYLMVVTGLTCFVLPGVILLTLYGWLPMRVLLRGESPLQAMKASALLMVRWWPPVVLSAVVMSTFCLLASGLFTLGLNHSLLEPTPWQRLTTPAIWVSNFVNLLISVWLSGAFLALFHRLEAQGIELPKEPS